MRRFEIPENSKLLNTINRIFIPCINVLEMEVITSLFLHEVNYDQIKDVPKTHPSSKILIKALDVHNIPPFLDVIHYFNDYLIPKVKPLVMYQRDYHDRLRRGNIKSNNETRICLFVALHRLKMKFLIIRNFIQKFKIDDYKLVVTDEDGVDSEISFLSALSEEYFKRNKKSLNIMIPKSRVSDRVKDLLDNKDSITGDQLLQLATIKDYSKESSIIKFILREIKASLFVINLLFAKMDVLNPFSLPEKELNIEETMISNDFLPELILALSKNLKNENKSQIKEILKAFDFLMDNVLLGINKAIEIASEGEIQLGLYDLIYDMGNLFKD